MSTLRISEIVLCNVAILVVIAANENGYCEVLGAAEKMKEDKASWVSFFQWLRGRGLDGVKLVVGDKYPGHAGGRWRSVSRSEIPALSSSLLPQCVLRDVTIQGKAGHQMLKAIHAQESKRAAREKAKAVVEKLRVP